MLTEPTNLLEVRDSYHYTKKIGKGVFARCDIEDDTCLCQYTGKILAFHRIHLDAIYKLHFLYNAIAYVVDPIQNVVGVPVHVDIAKYINEPSALQRSLPIVYKKDRGTVLRYTGRRTKIRKNGRAVTVDSCNLDGVEESQKSFSNCYYQDFPVPLACYECIDSTRLHYKRKPGVRFTCHYKSDTLRTLF
jgi:hypothetical protein